jgi:L-malate glycosyltransferase
VLTVVMATRNGSRTLPDVLASFTRLQVPEGGWKLVVVDNGSTDRTREIVESFREKLPLTYVFEGTAGKSIALNAGIRLLEGDLVVFADDDVLPRPDWLVCFRSAADRHPEYSMFGGVVIPRFECEPPDWIGWAPLGPCFSASDPKLADGPTAPANLFGLNMAVRAETFHAGERFKTALGPRGADYQMGEDTELVERLGAKGAKAWHITEAVVEHLVRSYQMERSWVFRRANRFGKGSFRISEMLESGGAPCWFGIPRYLFRRLLSNGIETAKAWLTFNEQRRFLARWRFSYLLGQMSEARILKRNLDGNSGLNAAPVR